MPFIPHTDADVQEMLGVIGASSTDALFDEIPRDLRCGPLKDVPLGLSEMQVTRLMRERAAQDGVLLNFCGAGAYERHIPAAVWELTTRGEFYSSYTPYQAEASQGTLQLLYEYQSMMCALTGMEVSNASMYDGASALAEAILMAVRIKAPNGDARVLLPMGVHPHYRQVVRTLTHSRGVELVEMGFDAADGRCELPADPGELTAVVVPQPNFFGLLEDVDAATHWAHERGALVIALVDPVSLALLKPPGAWDGVGADICCGDGQSLGAPLSGGGPYFGFLTTRQKLVRQLPGRIVGRTLDVDGKPGYTLTLQAREQHIRRARATSNICTNQGLLVTAATIHMALLGGEGLARAAAASVANTRALVQRLVRVPGVSGIFAAEPFNEAALRLPRPAAEVLEALAGRGIFGGFDLTRHYPKLGNGLLVCATETRTEADIERYGQALGEVLQA